MSTASFLCLAVLVLCSTAASTARPSDDTVKEIQALESFKLNLHDPLGALDGWNSSTPSAPCDWRGIRCYAGRVRELRLPRLQLAGSISGQLSHLAQLRRLSLHSNQFYGSIPSLSQCSLLRAVYLQDNSFSGRLPPSIFNLTNLQVLNVAYNLLSGSIVGDLSISIRFLDVSFNDFSGNIPTNFTSVSQLQLINLSFNRFSGEIPASFGDLQRLEYLRLDTNELYGTLPSAIANCSSLVHLGAENNDLTGIIPATIGLLPRLQVIALSRNQLFGLVPPTLFCNVSVNPPSIRILQLGLNAFTGIVNPPTSSYSSILEVLDLHENHINQVFPSWLTNITTLQILDLSGNLFSGVLPRLIGSLSRLKELRLANNSIGGEVPNEIQHCGGSLAVLDLEANRFSGLIPDFLGGLKNLRLLSLGGNRFTGSIPWNIGTLDNLESLNLSNNKLNGTIPPELMRLGNLSTLNLSNNKFSGEFPKNIVYLKGLEVLNMSGCGFSGRVPASVGSLFRLTILDLSQQNLSGELPFELYGLPNLQVIVLGENMLSGDVPEGFSSLSTLRYLNLSFNAFSGGIPATYGFLQSLAVLSLSGNRITGSIPTELSHCSNLEVLELRRNQLKGPIPDELSHLSRLKKLDLSQNDLMGDIPENLFNCSALTSLSLNFNHISGRIPDSVWKSSNLTALDLSWNNLSGGIPANLSLLPGLGYLNLSHNNLEGEIPRALAVRFNDASLFSKNKDLCGKPLNKVCKNVRRRRLKKLFSLIGVAVAGSCILALCCCGYVYSLLQWRKKLRGREIGGKKQSPRTSSGAERRRRSGGENGGPKLVMFSDKITYAETAEATRQFDEENVLSRGKYGLVFKATYQDGMVLAIRRLPESSSIDESAFRREAESLGKLRHRNLTVLRGYCAGPSPPADIRLLVYDYMPNGNLATLLQEASHQDGHVLNWPMRHLIALGIARGLSFLHSNSLVHGDIKPQNVLFDADFEPHLSDFGLDKLTSIATPAEASTSSTPTAAGTAGYVSPETAMTGLATTEADVYTFGIVLLEILTGRKPVMFDQEDEDIVKWVKRQLQRSQISELLEPGLLELDPESSEWEEFLLGLKVGLLCTMTDPNERPSMNDVVFMLEGCRVGPELPSSADPTSPI